MKQGKHRRSRIGEISADLYAEYAAYLSSETLEFYVKKRREISAAIYIQYHFRRFRSARDREQLQRLVLWRMLLRWRNVNTRIKAASRLCSACKSFISRSLLQFVKSEALIAGRVAATVPIGDSYSGQNESHKATPQYGPFLNVVEPHENEHTRIVSSANISVGQDDLMEATSITPSAPVSPAKTVHQLSPTRRKRMVFIDESSEEEETASRTQEAASPSPQLPVPRVVKEDPVATNVEKLELVRSKILVYLVTKLQAMYRGQKGRAVAARLRRVRDQKRELDQKMQSLRVAVFKAAEERKARKPPKVRKALPPVVESSLIVDELVDIDETSQLARKKSMSLTATLKAGTDIVPSIGEDALPNAARDVASVFLQETDFDGAPDASGRAMNVIKAKILSFQRQSALKSFEAHALIHLAAHSISHAGHEFPTAVSRIVSMDPVGILFPQDVEGLLDHGVVVDETSPIKGSKIQGAGWVVAEVTDAEMYELHPELVKASATKIQTIFRRFMTRRKFMAYLQEKDLNAVRDEERRAYTEGSSVYNEESSTALGVTNETVSTESCVIS